MFKRNSFDKLEKFKTYLYVLKISDNTSKIGITHNMAQRIKFWKGQYKKRDKEIEEYACCQLYKGDIFEDILHETLQPWNVKTDITYESYYLDFDELVDRIIPACVKFSEELLDIKID